MSAITVHGVPRAKLARTRKATPTKSGKSQRRRLRKIARKAVSTDGY